jgi:hypothetical protein
MAPTDPAPATLDADALQAAASRCFELAMTDGIAAADQARFLASGRQLRQCLARLVGARFSSRTPELLAANAAIASANRALEGDLQEIQEATAAIQAVTDLVGKLDQALAVLKLA